MLQAHPESAERALRVLDHWETAADPASKPLRDEWRHIIENKLWALAVEDSDRGQVLRQASPLGLCWTKRRGAPSLNGIDDASRRPGSIAGRRSPEALDLCRRRMRSLATNPNLVAASYFFCPAPVP